ncbi:MAG: hypothetical protein Q8Q32_00435 [bacterium]|nr:hypothetical protein [bacterium]
MQITLFTNILILLVIWGAQLKLRSFLLKKIKLILTTAILAPAITLLGYSYILYGIWLNSPPPIRYFLPPHSPISYYFFTIGRRFWISYFIALLIALIFLLLMQSIKKERRGLIFEKEEPYLICAALVLVGHPFWIIYLLFSILIYLIFSFAAKGKRISLYYLWMPIAILILALSPLLNNIEALSQVKLYL